MRGAGPPHGRSEPSEFVFSIVSFGGVFLFQTCQQVERLESIYTVQVNLLYGLQELFAAERNRGKRRGRGSLRGRVAGGQEGQLAFPGGRPPSGVAPFQL